MPTFQIEAILIRIGLALVAGVLIAIPPILWRHARFANSKVKRVVYCLLTLLFLVGFIFYARFLWNRFVPAESDTPPPIEYPAAPAIPTAGL